MNIIVLIICGLFIPVYTEDLIARHMIERNALLEKEAQMMLGSDIVLNENEQLANKLIMRLKHKIIDDGFAKPQFFNFSKHFFTYKEEVKGTELYQILKEMPKGALLHAHDTAVLKPEYLLKITYWDNLYVCFFQENIKFIFSKDLPKTKCESKWQLMKDARDSSKNIEKFDSNLKKHFTIVIDNPNEVYTDVNTVWDRFMVYFIETESLLSYKPAWEYYFYETMKALREENVMYLEIRSILPQLYDLEGNVYTSVDTATSYKKTVDKFIDDYPDFFGAKLVYSPLRKVDQKTVSNYVEIAKEIKAIYPDFLAGFDLVGQEDLGVPTIKFLKELTEIAKDFDFIFHGGETNWYGTTSDENLFDIIVLGTRRIGHGYALSKHPALLDEVKKRDIAVEVNLVSNAVLCLLNDIRNHPLATYIARGIPVVISSDDPGPWEADPLTHDFFITFVGVSSKHADLRLLKKLALNSLKYSTFGNKENMIRDFETRWQIFINKLVKAVHSEL